MKRLAFPTIAAWITLALPLLAIDLTPRYIDTFTDGVQFRRLFFADGDTKIGLSVDRETKVESGRGGVIFRFIKFEDASLLVKHSPLTPDQPFNDLSLDRYREAAHRMLPPGTRGVKTLEETPEPIAINHWHSYRILLACEAEGRPMMQSVTFLNLNNEEQLVLVTSAHSQDFPEAAARSWRTFRTWQPLLPGDELAPTKN
jgi:hypothetical protein